MTFVVCYIHAALYNNLHCTYNGVLLHIEWY